MKININKSQVAWSYIGYLYKILVNIAIIPLTASFLSPKELGLWFTFASLGGVASLLDFGFLPTITRNITYSWGGASEILKEGVGGTTKSEEVNIELLISLLHVSKRIYLIISLIAGGLLLSAGTVYIKIISVNIYNQHIFIAWIIYSIGVFLNIYYEYWNAFLRGTGLIKEAQYAQIISLTCQIVLTSIGLLLHFNLIAISFSYLCSGVALRQVSKYFFWIKNKDNLRLGVIKNFENILYKDIFKKVWHNAWKSGLTTVGSFVIAQGTTLLCSAYLGLETTASYGLTIYMFNLTNTIASIPYNTYTPQLNGARLLRDENKLRELLSVTIFIGWVCYFTGWLFIVFFGDKITYLIHSQTQMLPRAMIFYLGAYLMLEFNHTFFCNFITTSNIIPFVKPSLISGFLILLVSIILLKNTSLGLWSIMLSQSIIQLSYNNWKWPYMVSKELKITLLSIFRLAFPIFIKKSVWEK
jgi:O-antigen/teichoic acid export membrane protein